VHERALRGDLERLVEGRGSRLRPISIQLAERELGERGRCRAIALPTGLVDSGLNLLKNAIADGVDVRVVNIMTMDYGSSFPPDKMGQNAIDAGNCLIGQLKAPYPGRSDAQIRAMVELT
jgi:repressor of nif and glnA expression